MHISHSEISASPMVFKLFVVRESRVFLSIITVTLSIMAAVWLAINIHYSPFQILLPILLVLLTTSLAIYFTCSRLDVKVDGNQIEFHWASKALFGFSSIEKISLDSIKYLVIDQDDRIADEVLKSIRTEDSKISLGIGKFKKMDSDLFINFLKQNSNAKIISSWDTFKKL